MPLNPNDHNPYLADPDVLLFLEFQKGQKTAFETLMHKYYKRILNFIYRSVGNQDAAEDLTQEVFIRVYQHAASYRPSAKFHTWLYTIAYRLSLNELRRGKRKTVSLETPEPGDYTFNPSREISHSRAVAGDLLKQEMAGIIRRAIEELPVNQRTAVILRRFENLSYEDIAQTMNCSVQAVKSLLNRAKEKLKGKLSGYVRDDLKSELLRDSRV